MTGAFVRIKRSGRWVNVDITELTDPELDAFFAERDAAEVRKWVRMLAGWIRDNIKVQ